MESHARPEITRAPVTAVVIGLVAGMFSALLGVAGGLLMLRALVRLLSIRPHRAHATSLVVVLPTAAAGVYGYAEHGHVEWSVALLLAAGGVVGAVFGTRLASVLKFPWLKPVFGAGLAGVGIVMILWSDTAAASGQPTEALAHRGGPMVFTVGILVGMVSGLIGVGGDVVMVPAIVFLLGLSQRMAQGISLAVLIPAAISGGLIHYRRGNVIPSLAAWLSCGAFVGATIVSNWVGRIEDETLRILFGIFLITVGVPLANRRPRPG